jgi:hypothetical protein
MQGIQKLAADAVRFANELRAWVEVEDGRVTGHGHLGGAASAGPPCGPGRSGQVRDAGVGDRSEGDQVTRRPPMTLSGIVLDAPDARELAAFY